MRVESSTNEFFKVLYQRCTQGQVEFRFIPPEKKPQNPVVTKFTPLSDFKLPLFPKGKNIYFGVATRDGIAGTKSNLIEIPALWTDLDFKATPPKTLREKFQDFPLKTSLVVETGGGYHAYCLLREPSTKDDILKIEGYLKRIASFFGGDLKATDASHILRVPATLNVKPEYNPPRQVTIKKLTPSLEYNLADFDFLPELEIPGDKPTGTSLPPDWQDELLKGVPEGERNSTATRLAGRLLGKGHSESEVLIFLLSWNQRNIPPLPEREIQAILESMAKTHRRNHPEEKTQSHKFNLVSVKDLLQEQDEETQWVWDGILPQGGMSLLVSKPKVGKSTLALNLAVAISRGMDFLGRPTALASVVYLALEEKRSEIRKRLEAMNVKEEPLHLHFGLAPKGAIDQIDLLLSETGARLLIVDTLQKLARVKDLNDYAVVTTTLEPLLGVARARNCHLLLTHHAGKADRTDGDEILGSTALLGAVDTAIILKKRDQGRTISTVQRYGENMPETVILLGQDYFLTIAGSLEAAKKQHIWLQIKPILEDHPGLIEQEIIEAASCRKVDTASALRWAFHQKLVSREGAGKRGDPFKYFLPPLPPAIYAEVEKQNLFFSITHEDHESNSPPEILEKSQTSGRENSELDSLREVII